MKLEELKNKKILIVGRGIEGNAAYKYLHRRFPNAVIDIVDQKDDSNYLDSQKNYDIAIKSPGVKLELIKIPYTTATNIFLSNAKGKVIGVTGTKGKSTTSTLIYKMLRKQGLDAYLGGNIGQSPLDFLDKLNDQPASPRFAVRLGSTESRRESRRARGESWTVLELSSFQLLDITKSPHIAVLLMITSEHLDYHETYRAYIDAKRNILRFQNPQDFAIINRDYLESHESDIYTKGKIFQISQEREVTDGCFVEKDSVWYSRSGKQEKIIGTDRIKLLGRHNLENVCAAVCAATLAGVSKKNTVKAISEFGGLEHRLEFVGEKNGIRFYNDSLATIPQATVAAMEALANTGTLIAGGHDRGIDYRVLAKYLKNGQIKTLILFPPTGKRIWEEICKEVAAGNRPEKFDVKTMKQAVRIAAVETAPGKICLLSPGSASFGIFKDYKDRGGQFKQEINKLS